MDLPPSDRHQVEGESNLSDLLEALNDNSWSVLEEVSSVPQPSSDYYSRSLELETSQVGESSKGKELAHENERSNKSIQRQRRIKYVQTQNPGTPKGSEEVAVVKKLDHNAKERVRRMKLNASYLALRSLLPDYRRSKKRLCAPAIIDRVLEYVPKLEDDVEKLKAVKEKMQSSVTNRTRKQQLTKDQSSKEMDLVTVSVNEVREGEVIIQICMPTRDDYHKDQDQVFTYLLKKVEGEEMSIKSASTLCVSQERVCFHLHIQMRNGWSSGAGNRNNIVAETKAKFESWLLKSC